MNDANAVVQTLKSTIHQPLYSTAEIQVGTTQIQFFNTVVGDNFAIAATPIRRIHTNMTQAGALPAQQRMTIMAVRMFMHNQVWNHVTDLPDEVYHAVFDESLLTIEIQDKKRLELHSKLLLAGGGPVGHTSQDPAVPLAMSNQYMSNGAPDSKAIFVLSEPIVIEPRVSFQITLDVTAANNAGLAGNHKICVMLDGMLERNVN